MTDTNITAIAKIEVINAGGKVINTFYRDPSVDNSSYTRDGFTSLANGVLNKLPSGLDIRDALETLSTAYEILSDAQQSIKNNGLNTDEAETSSVYADLSVDDLMAQIFGRPAPNKPDITKGDPEAVQDLPMCGSQDEMPEHMKALIKELGLDPARVQYIRIA